jgi:FkbM family methyltransferase
MKSRALPKVASVVRPWLPKALRPHRVLTGPLRGARIVTSWHDYPAGIAGITERPLIDWFQKHVTRGSTWLDIGAHYGYTAVALSRLVGETGRVFAFEPMTITARCISETRELNALDQLTVVPKGLGCPDTVTTTCLPTVRGMADRTLNAAGGAASETIRVVRFDWLWPQLNGGRGGVDGVKIDVQGMEIEVLQGMQSSLAAQHPLLVVELHLGVSRAALMVTLKEAGYTAAPVPINRLCAGTTGELDDNQSYYFAPPAIAGRRQL